MALLTIDEPLLIQRRLAVFRLGFRPFFLLGPLFGALATTYFIAIMSGIVAFWPSAWDLVAWHRHEMLFGYTGAIIAGFLLTAVPNWTGYTTPKGIWLAGLAILWIIGRACVFFSFYMPSILVMALDSSFFLFCAFAIMPALIKARNKRNYMFIALLCALSITNLLSHAYSAVNPELAKASTYAALNIIILIMITLGGRVIPFFTERGIAANIVRFPWLEKIAMPLTAIALIGDVALPEPPLVGIVFICTASLHAIRMYHWKTLQTLKSPLLWILHAGFAWIIAGMLLKGLFLLGFQVPPIIVTHCFTAGAIGSLTLGMMARVSLGHTGRELRVGKLMTFAFILITFSAILRVFGVWLMPHSVVSLLAASAILWIAAFVIYAFYYFPILITSRVDGRDG